MPLLLPNLDDRSWADLADEGRALIPVYGPEWTDHNASDPGITLLELLAWKTEMDIYRLNQVTDAERLRFLNLVSVRPRGPQPGYAVLSLSAKSFTPTLPASLEFSGVDANNVESRYHTLREITLAPGKLTALQTYGAGGFQNLTPAWKRMSKLYPFGTNPQVDGAFYLGLSDPLPVNAPATFYFTFGDGFSTWKYREELIEQLRQQAQACRPQRDNPCLSPVETIARSTPSTKVLTHYGVRTVWEYLAVSAGRQQWVPLEAVDETRCFTLDGAATFLAAEPMVRAQVGAVGSLLYYLRCRIDAGRYDAAPLLSNVGFNAVRAVQEVKTTSSFTIAADCAITYASSGPPRAMDESYVHMQLDAAQRITQLDFVMATETDPQFTILDFVAPKDKNEGTLTMAMAFLGFGSGLPAQQLTLPTAPVVRNSVRIFTQEKNSWHTWKLREDFLSSTRRDAHAALEPTSGVITFGNGEQGRVIPAHAKKNGTEYGDSLVFASFAATRADEGKLGAGAIRTLVDSQYNRALLSQHGSDPNGWQTLQAQLTEIENPLASSGGTAAETLNLAAGRADELVDTSGRAVTLADYERFACSTPGARIARATAIANLHPDFPCYKAPGMITVIVLPYLPQGKPMPTPGLLRSVSAQLRTRRVVGTRAEVIAPTYLEVTVRATVQAKQRADKVALQTAVVNALNSFFDPITGGPDNTGWPLGRSVYRAEILRILSEVASADYVTSLVLIAGEGPPQCGNICLGPTWLVAPGGHQIQVL